MRLEGVSCVSGRTSSFPAGERNQRLPGAGEDSMRRAGPRTPLMQAACVGGASQGRPGRGSLRFRTNGPVENVPFSTTGLCLGVGRCGGEGRASHVKYFKWRSCCTKASPERGGAREAGGGVRSSTPQGRGGSVSRRDHDQAYWRRAQLSGGTKQEERRNSNAIRSSGEGGLGERRFSQRSGLSPRISLPQSSSGGSAREGASL